MNIKVIMMLKNEDDLARCWIAYHAALVGHDNLIVLDNGSTSRRTLDALDWGRRQGVRVDSSFATAQDYKSRHELYGALINFLDRHNYADFWFPLDCDEFLAVGDGQLVWADRARLEAELAPYRHSAHPLSIAGALDNHPRRPGYFSSVPQRKIFFAAGACAHFEPGFHHGRAKSGLEELSTQIVYVHFHYKPFAILQQHARAKLAVHIDDFSRDSLLAHLAARGPSFHSISHLLIDEAGYHRSFSTADYRHYPQVEAAFSAIGERLPFS